MMSHTQHSDSSQDRGKRILRYVRLILSGFGIVWSSIVISQTYQEGLSLLLTPSHYYIHESTYFGIGFAIFLASFWVLTEEYKISR